MNFPKGLAAAWKKKFNFTVSKDLRKKKYKYKCTYPSPGDYWLRCSFGFTRYGHWLACLGLVDGLWTDCEIWGICNSKSTRIEPGTKNRFTGEQILLKEEGMRKWCPRMKPKSLPIWSLTQLVDLCLLLDIELFWQVSDMLICYAE